MASAFGFGPPAGWDPRELYDAAVSPTEPGESVRHLTTGEAYGPPPQAGIPQSVVAEFSAANTYIHESVGVLITTAVVRGDGALALIPDRRVVAAWNLGWLQLAVTASRPGHWQAHVPGERVASQPTHGATAYADLGTEGAGATWWLFPDRPGPLVLWLFAYVDGHCVAFDPRSTYPHRIDTNGALRCYVPAEPR